MPVSRINRSSVPAVSSAPFMNTNMSPKKSMLVLFCLSLSLFFNSFQSLTTGHWFALILIFSWYYCFLFPEGLYGLLFQFPDFIVSRQNGGISSGCPSTMRAITTHLCLSLLHKLSHKDLSALDTSKQNSVSTPPPTLCVAFGS